MYRSRYCDIIFAKKKTATPFYAQLPRRSGSTVPSYQGGQDLLCPVTKEVRNYSSNLPLHQWGAAAFTEREQKAVVWGKRKQHMFLAVFCLGNCPVSFCCYDKTHWPEAAWGVKGWLQLTLSGYSPSLMEVIAETQTIIHGVMLLIGLLTGSCSAFFSFSFFGFSR